MIPLPPIEVQKEIVEQIEVKQNAINAAREVIKNLERERDDILAKSLES
jgi:restriction endonuclease S subunit